MFMLLILSQPVEWLYEICLNIEYGKPRRLYHVCCLRSINVQRI